jgi:hypothetical protein
MHCWFAQAAVAVLESLALGFVSYIINDNETMRNFGLSNCCDCRPRNCSSVVNGFPSAPTTFHSFRTGEFCPMHQSPQVVLVQPNQEKCRTWLHWQKGDKCFSQIDVAPFPPTTEYLMRTYIQALHQDKDMPQNATLAFHGRGPPNSRMANGGDSSFVSYVNKHHIAVSNPWFPHCL